MLQKLAEHIEAAKRKAAEAEERAARASSFDRAQQLELAKAWRHVVSSYEFMVSMEKFLIDAHRSESPSKTDDLPKPPSLDKKH